MVSRTWSVRLKTSIGSSAAAGAGALAGGVVAGLALHRRRTDPPGRLAGALSAVR